MSNGKLIEDVKDTIEFYETEVAEFTKMRDAAKERLAELDDSVAAEERDDLDAEIIYFQEFVNESESSLKQFQDRLAELSPKS